MDSSILDNDVWMSLPVCAVTLLLGGGALLQTRRAERLRQRLDAERMRAGDEAVDVVVATATHRARRFLYQPGLPSGFVRPDADGVTLFTLADDGRRTEQRFAAGTIRWLGLRTVHGVFHEWIALGRGEAETWVAVARTGGSEEMYRSLTGSAPSRAADAGSCFEGSVVYPARETVTERLYRLAPVLVFGGLLFVAGKADLAWLSARVAATADDDFFGAAYAVSLLLGHLMLLMWGMALLVIHRSIKFLRAERWPRVDDKVDAPTRVIRGACLRVRWGVLPAAVVIGLLAVSGMAIHFVETIYSNARDRQVAWLLRPVFSKPKPPAALAESIPSNPTAGQAHP